MLNDLNDPISFREAHGLLKRLKMRFCRRRSGLLVPHSALQNERGGNRTSGTESDGTAFS